MLDLQHRRKYIFLLQLNHNSYLQISKKINANQSLMPMANWPDTETATLKRMVNRTKLWAQANKVWALNFVVFFFWTIIQEVGPLGRIRKAK